MTLFHPRTSDVKGTLTPLHINGGINVNCIVIGQHVRKGMITGTSKPRQDGYLVSCLSTVYIHLPWNISGK
jgi:hypothetical protein